MSSSAEAVGEGKLDASPAVEFPHVALPSAPPAAVLWSRFLTIGTYPRPGAFAELQRAAKAKGSVSVKIGDGGLAVFSQTRPTSVYVGYPDAKYQVEVFHPSPDEARRLALSGQIVPVE